ncbi:STAS domain-containing protein [Nocardioides sp. CPCC 205120]|uniref:STAS domain-containing protein n=1 Tax=Nocardioides sp. CPCC 205120 TaxID=3406462 RepID=UPI003B501AAB
MHPDALDFDAAPGRLTLAGDIEAHHDADLLDSISQASGGHERDVFIDLSAVTFLPSSIVGTLLRARALAARNGAAVTLAARAETVPKRVLEVCGVPHEVVR